MDRLIRTEAGQYPAGTHGGPDECQEKELLTAAEAAERLRIEKRTLLKWARENKIESVKLSRKVVLFTAEAVDDFVEGRSKKTEPAPMNHQEAGKEDGQPDSKKEGRR